MSSSATTAKRKPGEVGTPKIRKTKKNLTFGESPLSSSPPSPSFQHSSSYPSTSPRICEDESGKKVKIRKKEVHLNIVESKAKQRSPREANTFSPSPLRRSSVDPSFRTPPPSSPTSQRKRKEKKVKTKGGKEGRGKGGKEDGIEGEGEEKEEGDKVVHLPLSDKEKKNPEQQQEEDQEPKPRPLRFLKRKSPRPLSALASPLFQSPIRATSPHAPASPLSPATAAAPSLSPSSNTLDPLNLSLDDPAPASPPSSPSPPPSSSSSSSQHPVLPRLELGSIEKKDSPTTPVLRRSSLISLEGYVQTNTPISPTSEKAKSYQPPVGFVFLFLFFSFM